MNEENTRKIFDKIMEIPLRNQMFEIKNVYNFMYLYSEIIFYFERVYSKKRMYENSVSYYKIFIQIMNYFLEQEPKNHKFISRFSKKWVEDHVELLNKGCNPFDLYSLLLQFLRENNIVFDQNIEIEFDVFTS